MRKKSKLREKGARFAIPGEAKRKLDLQKYCGEIVRLNVETARGQRFMLLLKEWFSEARPSFIEDYLKGIEKFVKVKGKDFVFAGRVDALYGNVIIEFESNIAKKLKEAKGQLKDYAYALLNSKQADVNFLCIATDGVSFYVFVPHWADLSEPPASAEDVDLRQVDKANFLMMDANQAFFWLDRYFFRTQLLHPTTEEFVRDFGFNSPAYAFALKLLQKEWKKVESKSEFKVIFENWEKYLRIAYGTTVADTELFLRHTYLAAFAKLLAYMRLARKNAVLSASEIDDIFTGKFFQKLGILNFLEEDFLSWIAREKVREILVELTRRISTLLEKYYLEEISEDVLKSLYQELVDPQTRHDLGEFYTPDWLADSIIRHVLKSKPEASVLDPACGSGSFLYFAIRYKREKLGDSKQTLDHVRDNVVGIDIHPLAVTIAKTNYILGLGDLILKRPKDFIIPVYMANSLRVPERGGQPTLQERVPSFYVELDNTLEPVPEIFVEHPAAFDEAIETCHSFALQSEKADLSPARFAAFAKRHIAQANVDDVTLETLFNVARRMRELMDKERNSIWTFILKNVYKPTFLQKQFDWVVGNPPWLSYRYIEKGEYQQFVKNAILNAYCLLDKGEGHLITHLELGTLFFCAALSMYAKPRHNIAFVLPRSVFTADQHDRFRKASFGKAIHLTGLTEVWDLEKVNPLFNVPSCVVFGKHFHHTERPIKAKLFTGQLKRRNASLEEARTNLTIRDTSLHLVKRGDRSFWSEDAKAEFAGPSPYRSKFAQGATIVPRSCWFVQVAERPGLGFNPEKPYVKTDPRATEQAKEAYKELEVEGNIEKDFLYATLLSTDLVPFGFLDYRPVVLPIKPSGELFVMLDREYAQKEGLEHLAEWLNICEKEWNKRRKEKAEKMSIYDRLDYVHGITQQRHKAKYKVIYPTSATNLCGAVVPNEKITITVSGQTVTLKGFVAESKLYYFESENEQEAHYLAAFLNSQTVDDLIKPMQSRGLWGPRDIHKKVWELPIPIFNESKSTHKELAELGVQCAGKVAKIIPTLNTQHVTPGKIGRLRNEVRERLADELNEIDGLVKKVMGS
jgi:hypothetical protein